jgi:hypothetical protein
MRIEYHFLLTLIFLIVILIFLYFKYNCSATINISNLNDSRVDSKPIWLCPKKNNRFSRITNIYNKKKSHQSMGIFDKWSVTHITHGVAIFIILIFLNNYKKTISIFYWTLIIEILWEIFENTPYIINKYRKSQVDMYRDYVGDSVANMISDIIFALFGLIIAWYLPIHINIIFLIFLDFFTYIIIGDNLLFNIYTLL